MEDIKEGFKITCMIVSITVMYFLGAFLWKYLDFHKVYFWPTIYKSNEIGGEHIFAKDVMFSGEWYRIERWKGSIYTAKGDTYNSRGRFYKISDFIKPRKVWR